MKLKHLLLVIFVMFVFGSVYPLGKLGTNTVPPILFSSLRVLIIFFGILPLIKFKLPSKKMVLPLLAFSLTLGTGVYITLYLALDISSLVSPIIIGTQLTEYLLD
jgi:O-acetylserine/cysteine efflux transporter